VFSAGIRPRDELACASGLAVGERGGIVINNACHTSDPDIHAIGECALWEKKIFGLVAPGSVYDLLPQNQLNRTRTAARPDPVGGLHVHLGALGEPRERSGLLPKTETDTHVAASPSPTPTDRR
jgi:hypothetical protein